MLEKNCKTIQKYLSRYVDGELSEEDTRFVERHLETCGPCSEAVKQLRSVSSRLTETFAALGPTEVLKKRLAGFLSSIAGAARGKARLSFPLGWTWPPSWRLAGGIATLLVCLGIGGAVTVSNYVEPLVRAKVGGAHNEARRVAAGKYAWESQAAGEVISLGVPVVTLRASPVTVQTDFSLDVELPVAPTTEEGLTITDSRKVIRNAEIQIVVENVSTTLQEIRRITNENNGMIANASLSENEKSPWARLTLWVPADDLDRVMEQLASLGKVRQQEIKSQDITEQYFDLETRVRNLRRQEERLLTLYEREVKKLDEILKVEKEIERVRTEIERLEGRQRLWKRQIRLSAIEVSLSQKFEEEPIAVSEPDDVFSPLRRALRDSLAVCLYSCSLITTLVAWIISSTMFLAPWLVLVVLVWAVGKRILTLLTRR